MSRENIMGDAGELSGRKRRLATPSAIAVAVGLAAFAVSAQTPAFAVDDQQLQLLEDQIRQLQAQIDALKKTQSMQAAEVPKIPAGTKPAYGYETGGHQFGWTSADGLNSIELTGRVHFDVADYVGYKNDPGLATTQLNSGANARRVRLGVAGKFDGDWLYALIADFGGSSDTLTNANAGAPTTSIENAFITYNGFNNPAHTVPIAIDAGYLDIPVQLNEAMSSNDRLLMEAPTSEVIASGSFGGNDARSAFGFRSYKTQYWAGVYVTGPAAGASHTVNAQGQGEPLAYMGRATYNPIQDADTSVHVGGSIAHVVNTGSSNAVNGTHTLTLSDRPELRVDPTALLTTGAISNVNGATVVGGELAAAYKSFFAQGEYYAMMIDRSGLVPGTTANVSASSLNFSGGYLEASYTIGGARHYNASTGAYGGVNPDNPLSMKEGGGWGAVELAARFSEINLNDNWQQNVAAANNPGIEGGEEKIYSVGVNYYPYNNIKLMLDWIHTDLTRLSTAAASTANGAKIDAIAGRFQVAF